MTVEQGALLDAARRGEEHACERLILENERLIWAIVGRYTGRGVETDDLYQLGCIGFLKALKGFDVSFGTQFSTYAVPKIAGEIRRFLRDDGAVKVSRTIKERAARLAIARERLRRELGREPQLSELADAAQCSAEDVVLCEQAITSVASLQAETTEGLTLESQLGDEGMEERLIERVALLEAVERLSEREQMVLRLRYWKGCTQSAAARVIGVSQVQVSRLERRAVERLRVYLNGEGER